MVAATWVQGDTRGKNALDAALLPANAEVQLLPIMWNGVSPIAKHIDCHKGQLQYTV